MVLARTVQCYMLLLARFCQQSMRNALAPLLVYMMRDPALNLDDSEKASLISAVAAGYFLTQVPGGALAGMIGGKNVVSLAILGSALACAVIPFAAEYSPTAMWFALAFMGAIQGPLFPTSSVFLSSWSPPDERAWASSQLDIGISVGALCIVPAANKLAIALGWREAYMVLAGCGVVYVLLWSLLGANSPSECWFISKEELAYLDSVIPKKKKLASETPTSAFPAKIIFHPSVLAIFFCHMAFNFGAYFVTNWNPMYYDRVFGENPTLYLTLPHVSNLVGKILNTPLERMLVRRGYSRLACRKIFTLLGFLGSGFAILPVYASRDFGMIPTTILITVANGMYGLCPSGFKANYLDITVKYVGVVSGIGNTLGTVSSYLGPLLVGYILEKYSSWQLIFFAIFAVNTLSSAFYLLRASVDPVEELVEGKED